MQTQLVISDLTRMQDQRVCIAGYDEGGRCIRPVLPPPGILESVLYTDGQPSIFPFAVVQFDLIRSIPQPPHTEDHLFDPGRTRPCGSLPLAERRPFLQCSLAPTAAAIFEQPIHAGEGFYVLDGAGPRSLGTIQPGGPLQITFQAESPGTLKPRIAFTDGAGTPYRLAVTDLAWRYYAEHLQRTQALGPEALAAHLTAALAGKEVFLRIGLARGWSQHPDRCYLQVTGIHTFPDYLAGRTFADFAPPSEDDDW